MSDLSWLVPGAKVAIVHHRFGGQHVFVTEVEKVLKRDVVVKHTTDRYSLKKPTFNGGLEKSGSGWSNDVLYPADHPDVLQALNEHEVRHLQAQARGELDGASSLVTEGQYEEALKMCRAASRLIIKLKEFDGG